MLFQLSYVALLFLLGAIAKTPSCGLAVGSVCSDDGVPDALNNTQCLTDACLFDIDIQPIGTKCLQGAAGGGCLTNDDCITENCSMAAGEVSYCKLSNGTKVAKGTCLPSNSRCYHLSDCLNTGPNCVCQALGSSHPQGTCMCF